jgi:hypothetical protein
MYSTVDLFSHISAEEWRSEAMHLDASESVVHLQAFHFEDRVRWHVDESGTASLHGQF